jgi:hypothetical protein
MFDALWPFTLAYSQDTFSRCQLGAPIYVLDIGLYLLPLLRTVFPSLRFVPFSSTDTLPPDCEPVDLTGLGMAPFSLLGQPPSPATGHSTFFDPLLAQTSSPLSVIRDIVLSQLNLSSTSQSPQCIVLLSRTMSPEGIAAFHERHLLDLSREAPDLKPFHDLGPHVHTALFYLSSTAHQRRAIVNEDQLFVHLARVFNKKFGICVKLVELSRLSLREQFETFTTAKVVIAQHGAGLAFAPFMPNTPADPGLVLELLPMINPTFHLTCEAMGVRHIFVDRSTAPNCYSSENNTFVTVQAKALVRLVAQHLEGWSAPVLGKVHNLTKSPSSSEPYTPLAPAAASPSLPPADQTCPTLPRESSLSGVPEAGYVHSMVQSNELPFVWRDSLHTDTRGELSWLHLSFRDWETLMKRSSFPPRFSTDSSSLPPLLPEISTAKARSKGSRCLRRSWPRPPMCSTSTTPSSTT